MDEDELAELTAKKPLRDGWKRSELKARRPLDDPKSSDAAPKTRAPTESRPSRGAEKRTSDRKPTTRAREWEDGAAESIEGGMFADMNLGDPDEELSDEEVEVAESWALQEAGMKSPDDVDGSPGTNRDLSNLVEELKNRKRAVESGERPSGRKIRCDKHGLEYDPNQSSGCVKCPRPIGVASLPVNRRVVVGLAAILVLGFVWMLSGNGDSNPRPKKEVPVAADDDVSDAADLHADAEDHSAAAQSATGPEVDRRILEGLRKVAEDAEKMLTDGQSDLEALRVAEASDGAESAAEVEARWSAWTASWQERMTDLRKTLPPQPGGTSDMNLIVGFEELESALDEIAKVAAPGSTSKVPSREERRVRFKSAFDALRAATQDLAKVRAAG